MTTRTTPTAPRGWKSGEVLAWTEHDGPGRGPAAPNRLTWFVLAGVLSAVFAGMILSDSLCPEHRALVRTLGVVALFGTGTAIVGLVRGWASAPVITLISATAGVVIGFVDAAHDPSRGRLTALAFAVAVCVAGFLVVRQMIVRRWARETLVATAPSGVLADRPESDEPVHEITRTDRLVQSQDSR